MALVMGAITFHIQDVDFKNKPQAMLDLSPKGTVPVLHLSDGSVLDESLDIIAWALPEEWAQADHDLIAENDGSFKRALDRYKYPTRYPDEYCSSARDQGEAFVKKLNQIMQPGTQSLTDICIFPFVRQFANVDRVWFDGLPYHNCQSWLDDHIHSALFQRIMDKSFQGNEKNRSSWP